MMRRGLSVLTLSAVFLATAAALAQPATVVPEPREGGWWQERHAKMAAEIDEGGAELLFIGDSITHGWESAGKPVWDYYYAGRKAVNLGISGDRTQHVLWRLERYALEKNAPKAAVIMIGTNNFKDDSAEDIAAGIEAIVTTLRLRRPEMSILLLGIFPRADVEPEYREKLAKASAQTAKLSQDILIDYMDIGWAFLDENDALPKSVMPDLLHPNEEGYWRWARAIEPKLAEMLREYHSNQPPKGFVRLFDGESLSGWKGLVADPEKRSAMDEAELAKAQTAADKKMRAHWSVDDGMLHFDGKGESLATQRRYGDVELLLDWKITEKGDSGVYMRGTPQIQIWDHNNKPGEEKLGSGGLYNNKLGPDNPLAFADRPVGQWNRFRIWMIGDRVTVWLNDVLVVDDVALENYWDRDKPLYALEQIELQSHGTPLWFRNVFIREMPDGAGWRPLYNERDLSGWTTVGGEGEHWFADGRRFYTEGEKGGWLSTNAEYSDFELLLEFRVPVGGNSGVFLRAPHTGNPAYEGMEVQILHDAAEQYKDLEPWQYCGSLYSVAAPRLGATLGANTWQKLRIRCDGTSVETWLNTYDLYTVDLATAKSHHDPHPGLKRKQGHIGLQNHGTRVDFRNVWIRPLNE